MKYPRTPHLHWSSNRTDDDKVMSLAASEEALRLPGLVVEEKVDGANCCVQFVNDQLVCRSRGHELRGGDHPQWDMLKSWASCIADRLFAAIGNRYAMWGEWLYAEHNIHYTQLPHYFLEFDLYDKETGTWLSTPRRHKLLEPAGIVSVPVIHRGPISLEQLELLVHGESAYGALFRSDRKDGTPYSATPAEGVYLKLEKGDETVGRAKWVRPDFIRQVVASDHWSKQPITPNALADGVNIWS